MTIKEYYLHTLAGVGKGQQVLKMQAYAEVELSDR